MPYRRKRSRRPIRRRRYKRRLMRRYRKPSSGFPQRMNTVLKYTAAFDSNATTITDYPFRGNGAYDPEYLTGGHQPYGYDQYSSIYGRYRVNWCNITAKVLQSSNSVDIVFGIVPTNTSVSSITDFTTIREMPRSRVKVLSVAGGGSSFASVHGKMSTKKMRGRSTQFDSDYDALISATPTRQWFWHFYIAPLQVSVLDCHVDISLTYGITFYKINDFLSS